ncbi:MAG: hypothetical protein ABW199_01530 [Caulobacterales bacterium]
MHPEEGLVSCACGAEYRREERLLPIRDIGLFECRDCAAVLETWSGRKAPHFTYLQNRRRAAAVA